MKRVILLVVSLVLCVQAVFSLPLLQTERGTIGMGSAGVALSSSPSSYLHNPALLYSGVRQKSSFILSGSYHDAIRAENFTEGLANPFMQNPFNQLSIAFSANNIALTIQNQVSLEERTSLVGATSFHGYTHTILQLDWATGGELFAFGVNAKALAVSERNPIEIRGDRFLSDYFVQTSLARFETLEQEAFLSVGFGLLLNYDWFKMALTSDTFAFALGSEPLRISADEIFKSMNWGISLSTPTYDSNNLLHLFKLNTALDFIDIGSEDSRELRFGFDLKLQLLPTWSVSIKSGYREPKALPSDLLKIRPSLGIHTMGVSAQFESFTLDIACEIPIQYYRGMTDSDSMISALLSLSFSI